MWDAANWQDRKLVPEFPHAHNSVAFSPDRKRPVGGGGGMGLVRLSDTKSWQGGFTLPGRRFQFYLAEFSPDGNISGAMSSDGNLHLWRALSWAEIQAAEAKPKAENQRP